MRWAIVTCIGLVAACAESSSPGSDGGDDAATDAAEPTDAGEGSDAAADGAEPRADAGSDGSTGCGDCDDGNPCTVDRCVEGECVNEPDDGAPCDDGVFCNGEDSCLGGECAEHAGDPCGISGCGACDTATDSCTGDCVSDAECPAEIADDWGTCQSDDPCATEGTQERTVTSFACEECECFGSTSTETRSCERTPEPGC